MNLQKPRELVEQELHLITMLFDELKMLGPMVIVVKDDRRTAIPVQFNSDAQKYMVSMGIRELVQKAEPDVVIYVSEAWALQLPKDTDLENIPRVKDHPDRIEVVAVQIEFKTGEKFGCEAKIIREGHSVHLTQFEIRDARNSTGRFVDFFPVDKKKVN